MQFYKKNYRDLSSSSRYKKQRENVLDFFAKLTGADDEIVESALWDSDPRVKLEADDEGTLTGNIILPPTDKLTDMFHRLKIYNSLPIE